MSNLTVSSAVDEFMQASDQADMVAALGTIAAGLPINNASDNPIIEVDGNENPFLQGYQSTGINPFDTIGFDQSGVASVYSGSDEQTYPIARTVGFASTGVIITIQPCSSDNSGASLFWVGGIWRGGTGLMGAMRPQTPHRSPRQAFGGNNG
jgi:hypothetical protein